MTETYTILRMRAAAMPTWAIRQALRLLDKEQPTEAERIVRAIFCDEYETRHPEVVLALESWMNDDDDERTYVQVILGTAEA